ncbi:3811_t:CDS:2, partial [Funneliformis geosporum]
SSDCSRNGWGAYKAKKGTVGVIVAPNMNRFTRGMEEAANTLESRELESRLVERMRAEGWDPEWTG